MAHAIVDVSEKALARPVNEGISFAGLENEYPITDQIFNDFEIRANEFLSSLNDMERILILR
ncbi:MAG: hypothetical protein JWO78_512 [Micavibrio sp.]|nr:hypothetical protein [Micavibrio sp.]